jgi:hypothetical protein
MNSFAKTAMLACVGIALSIGTIEVNASGFIDTIEAFGNGNSAPLGAGVPVLVNVPSPPINPQSVPVLVDTSRPQIDPNSAPILLNTKPGTKATAIQTADLLRVGCKVSGDDLVLANLGEAIGAGARVEWHAAGTHGTVVLAKGLRTGQKAKIADVLDIGGESCTAEII